MFNRSIQFLEIICLGRSYTFLFTLYCGVFFHLIENKKYVLVKNKQYQNNENTLRINFHYNNRMQKKHHLLKEIQKKNWRNNHNYLNWNVHKYPMHNGFGMLRMTYTSFIWDNSISKSIIWYPSFMIWSISVFIPISLML